MPFLDSEGLDVLASYCAAVESAGLNLVMVCERPALTRLFQATGFDRQIQLVTAFDDSQLGPRRPHRCRHE